MPELPEVEVVRLGLEPAVRGATVRAVDVRDIRSLRRHPGPAEEFVDRLVGAQIVAAVRRGKFLWLPLEHPAVTGDRADEALVAHLGMSGQLLLRAADAPDDRFTRIRLLVDHPDHGELAVHFADQRVFGAMALDQLLPTSDGAPGGAGSTDATVPSQVSHIARDPLDPAFSAREFFTRMARRDSGIKRVLLDQTLISGIGNIYADEALWAARLHFDQPASSISRRKAGELLAALRGVLEKALDEGGTSFDSQYVNVNGQAGYFAHSLNAYGRHGLTCPRCGTVMRREQFMNRGSHFCPRCQRLRRE
ncbi:bifunctional DNA-formamidopyrimidine glycosylase/DNA-(apurinic or apyrimidinic site) lyase [Ruicaihuangia caeni]|uniref:Formamidopyrimidine-DNA glycosylase n=1 Tax=Ruicaihuangia caeni TaxID=3042517 RepID=A0AAW6T7S1_9MICO|nr:bifunctional DNA-formamidopyrimidine glycosylase/DNA-(apurinic or apyrimidinic site) lyase [Klugiella sp. YN-L-19]MDI2097692.1 bifunctional DNA-formamidopyrimidine glycosylase/DNA-(apurinic or apyrimidinic site) lyase [Klugiella sp. YN-L-19]